MYLDAEGEKIMNIAQSGYEAYCNYTGWKSVITGDPLPQWSQLPGGVVNAWFAAAKAISLKMADTYAIKESIYYDPIAPESG